MTAPAPRAPTLAIARAWLDEGTAQFESAARALDENRMRAASALPGWTGGHVVAHLARNSDALVNLLIWARTGVETPMYADAAARNRDIDEGAGRPAAAIVDDLLEADAGLAAAIAELPQLAWAASVRTAQGRTVPAAAVPWMRVREVWVHAVDLGAARFADFPAPLLDALLDDALATMGNRDGAPHLALQDAGTGRERTLPGTGAPVVVRGPADSLCAYLLRGTLAPGLTTATGDPVPPAPRWL